MMHADFSPVRVTSVTIRIKQHMQLRQAADQLKRSGVVFSEQRLMRECLRLALRLWRGRKAIARRNLRYNQRSGPYRIVPFYNSEALRAVARLRCHHSGVSLSRLMDFAIACYLSRVVEYWLRIEYRHRDLADARLWQEKYKTRIHHSGFIISYQTQTVKNDGRVLDFSEKSEIHPWPPPNSLAA